MGRNQLSPGHDSGGRSPRQTEISGCGNGRPAEERRPLSQLAERPPHYASAASSLSDPPCLQPICHPGATPRRVEKLFARARCGHGRLLSAFFAPAGLLSKPRISGWRLPPEREGRQRSPGHSGAFRAARARPGLHQRSHPRVLRVMPRVLLISYLFPPGAGVGSPRALSYARYLPRYGCEVSVLTARFATTAYNDPNLLKLIPAGTPVYRAFNPEVPYRLRDSIWKKVAPPRLAAEFASTAQPKKDSFLPWKQVARRAIERLATPDVQTAWAWFATRKALALLARHRFDE